MLYQTQFPLTEVGVHQTFIRPQLRRRWSPEIHPELLLTHSCCSPTVWGETGVLSDGGSGESSKESKDPIVDVGVPKDPVVGVGALVAAVPRAAPVPARVEHLVGEVLGASTKSSSPSSRINRLV